MLISQHKRKTIETIIFQYVSTKDYFRGRQHRQNKFNKINYLRSNTSPNIISIIDSLQLVTNWKLNYPNWEFQFNGYPQKLSSFFRARLLKLLFPRKRTQLPIGNCNVVILEVNLWAKIISDKDNNYQKYFEVQISQIREAYRVQQFFWINPFGIKRLLKYLVCFPDQKIDPIFWG
jgi:hypothetical protein